MLPKDVFEAYFFYFDPIVLNGYLKRSVILEVELCAKYIATWRLEKVYVDYVTPNPKRMSSLLL